MIKERMEELSILIDIINNTADIDCGSIVFNNIEYDLTKIRERYKELMNEFLEPYIIE